MTITKKRSFIRGLWGILSDPQPIYARRRKVGPDIDLLKYDKYAQPFVTYVCGRENYEHLVKNGYTRPYCGL